MLHRGRGREGALPEPLRALDEGVSVGRHVGGQAPQHRDTPSTPDWSIVRMEASDWSIVEIEACDWTDSELLVSITT